PLDRGVHNIRLVKDFNIPTQMPNEPDGLFYLRKSEYWIDRADILLFIFFSGTDNASVGIELQTTLANPGNAWRSLLAYAEDTPSLVVGLGTRHQPDLSLIPFSNDLDIIKQGKGNIVRLLGSFYRSLYQRPSGEWETSSAS
ncbi:unnamed protein product, partial [marine sediment metagenome]